MKEARARYCSKGCYWLARWGGDGRCRACGKPCAIRFCDEGCQRTYWNRNDYHLRKKARLLERRRALLDRLGGRCARCGNDDKRVLEVNHKDRSLKRRPPKRNYTVGNRLREAEANLGNLEVLCANCHRIHTWEQMGWGRTR